MSTATDKPTVRARGVVTADVAAAGTSAVPYVDLHETHTGVVVLAGDRAYKAKKPVLTDFLDFRTPEQRERACHREVHLNSRLSPESYLGIAYLTDPVGAPPEPVVVMRRYFDKDRLAYKVSCGPDESLYQVLDTIAAMLARFHQRAQRSRAIDAQGQVCAVDGRFRENLIELNRSAEKPDSGFSFEHLARIQRLAVDFTSGRATLFTQRITAGCIVDGHGDLLADDIFCAAGEPALLDCLEFDDKLRYLDRIDDAAFLAMDLEFLGRADFGDYFLGRYAHHSGDTAPSSLRDFYIAYRAVVRAKVDCLRVSQGNPEAAADAARHLAIATRHLENGSVRMALVGGNPGTGKSTIARALAEKTGAQVISTDDVRRELQAVGIITGDPGDLDAGLYCPTNVRTVYDAVLHRARALLANGQSVILDGTWRNPHVRAHACRIACETFSTFVEIRCSAKSEVAADRIVTRRQGNSDVTPAIAAALAGQYDEWETAYPLDTSGKLDHSVEQAHKVWRRAVYGPAQRNQIEKG
ncbi:AAA family ATPase [Mycobacterium sp. M23085]|uniref:bifunctional aminoglycoside phosphotransferase/ATP-binding protein n=1 Tax=Mycobacterium sp. M23085 TaxID=3378087 RepID=UPI0038782835